MRKDKIGGSHGIPCFVTIVTPVIHNPAKTGYINPMDSHFGYQCYMKMATSVTICKGMY